MLSNVFSLLAACALVTAEDGFVVLPVTRAPVNRNSTHHVSNSIKVKAVVPEVLSNQVQQYLVSFGLGVNQQQQVAAIDTGSSDLWVYGAGSGAQYTFDPSNSEFVNNGFSITYVDQTGASGNYYKDYIEWGPTTIDFQFAVTASYNPSEQSPLGIFGIAQVGDEASEYGPYPNFPVALKNAGKIQSTAYSLYLDDVNSNSASLVFGAVDTSRYTGTLQLLPIVGDPGFFVNFEVFGSQQTGVLDSGTSYTYLPDDLVSDIANSYGAYYDYAANLYAISGSPPSNGLTYTFGEIGVTVPPSELWLQLEGSFAPYYLTILPYSKSENQIILGDSFLRSAYVVYDIDTNQIAIAQANWNPGPSNFEVITSSGIPGAQ